MRVFETILEAVGRTPLVRLRKLVGPEDATVLAKCEYLNPGGSVKDRMAMHILAKAVQTGQLKQGGTIVENTSGNTGAGIALWAAVNGFRCVFTIPDKMSTEKVNTLKAMGAEVVVTPTNVPADSPDSYYETAKRIARETPGSFYLNQYHNKLNIEAHYRSTGPEIWEDTEGKIDVFVAGIGTGGTMSGAGKYLKEKNPKVQNVAADPVGSVFHSLFKTGQMSKPHVYKVEGIGEDMICGALDMSVIDDIRQIDDKQSFVAARKLARQEGLFAGGSSGAAVHVAVQVAKELGKGKTVVVVLPDGGKSYISKFYSDEWMIDNGFMARPETFGTVADVLAGKADQTLLTASTGMGVGQAIATLKERSFSQMPVVDAAGRPVGMLHELDLLDALLEGRATKQSPVETVMQPLNGVILSTAPVSKLHDILAQGLVAVVRDGDKLTGLLTKIDLIDYISKRTAA
ncbi:MAG: pyridoxal-phosphate dependent enzyme [Deltaproteobacteria bacterium]|nr:pyridoxal-phosphate dependent enzyme [Deltaproteobacteria bacterium]